MALPFIYFVGRLVLRGGKRDRLRVERPASVRHRITVGLNARKLMPLRALTPKLPDSLTMAPPSLPPGPLNPPPSGVQLRRAWVSMKFCGATVSPPASVSKVIVTTTAGQVRRSARPKRQVRSTLLDGSWRRLLPVHGRGRR